MTRNNEPPSASGTKNRILDAAEILFASEGFHCTSLRTLTQKAEVNLAAVNYHFGSKEALAQALMERRLEPLNRQREEQLERVLDIARNEQRPAHSEDILRAFIEPTITFSDSGTGPRHFVAFIGRIMMEPDNGLRSIFLQRVRPLFGRFYAALRETLPEVSEQALFMRLQMTIGMLSHVMCGIDRFTGKEPELPFPPGVKPASSSNELCEMILAFVVPGLEKP